MNTGASAIDQYWYVRRGDDIRGPFAWEVIRRHAGLGRIHADDYLSSDRAQWWRSSELLPDLPATSSLAGGPADERAASPQASPTGLERRAAEDETVLARRARAARVWAGLDVTEREGPSRAPLLAVGLTLVVCVAAALRLSGPAPALAPDCRAAAAPGVNWEFCALAGAELTAAKLDGLHARNALLRDARLNGADLARADLAYAELAGADLTLATLERARLVGASLRNAKLNHARLNGADLSHADLTGASLAGAELSAARLSNTIWIDGRVCAHDAVGSCNPP